jgi:hypothetical protein
MVVSVELEVWKEKDLFVFELLLVLWWSVSSGTWGSDARHNSSSSREFEELRDLAIRQLCVALLAARSIDPDAALAYVARVSPHLLNQGNHATQKCDIRGWAK